MRDLVTRTEFARRINKSEKWVRKLLQAGKLPLDEPTGKIDWAEGFAAYRAAYPPEGAEGFAAPAPRSDPLPAWEPDQPNQVEQPHPAAGDAPARRMSPAEVNESANRARARKLQAQAAREELRLQEERGSLIPLDEVRADAVAVCSAIRAALLGLPVQVALTCEGKTAAQIEAVVADAVNALLAEWHQGRFV